MNLIDRVDAALDTPRVRIDHDDFERCATAFLAPHYQVLIPVREGTDWGADAEVIDNDGARAWMAITSSRGRDEARANLRRSMKSIVEHGLPGRRIVAVSLAVLNRRQRALMEETAHTHGFELVSVVDRAFFADRLVQNGSWRQKLLGLRGGPFSLSRSSSQSLADAHTDLVGRDELIEEMTKATGDLIVTGPPGIGKSAVLEAVPDIYFVAEDDPTSEQLLDDILETTPRVLAVDDVMKNPALLDRLQLIRRQEGIGFRIVAVCWPQQFASVEARLPQAQRLDVGPLGRKHIGQICRSFGYSRHDLMARIIQQAHGRPGWAVRLIALLQDGESDTVFTGRALGRFVRHYLSRADFPNDALQLLAVVSLLGHVDEVDREHLASFLGFTPMALAEAINGLAVGGLLDVEDAGPDRGLRFSVAPEPLPSNLVAQVCFGTAMSPVDIIQLFGDWPSHQVAIAIRLIQATFAGAERARTTAERIAVGVLNDSNHDGDISALITLSMWFSTTAAEAALALTERILLPISLAAASRHYASAVIAGHLPTAIPRFLDAATEDLRRGAKTSDSVHSFVGAVRRYGERPAADLDALVNVAQRAAAWRHAHADPASATVHAMLLAEALDPVFDSTYTTPDDRNSITMSAGALSAAAMDDMITKIWHPFATSTSSLGVGDAIELIRLTLSWTQLGLGRGLPFGGRTTTAQQVAARRHARGMGRWIRDHMPDSPALRSKLRTVVARLRVGVSEPDPLAAALLDRRDIGTDWEVVRATRRRELSAIVREHDPEALSAAIGRLKSDHVRVGNAALPAGFWDLWEAITETQNDLRPWVVALTRHDLIGDGAWVVGQAYRRGQLEPSAVQAFLGLPGPRRNLVNAAFHREGTMVTEILERVGVDDLRDLEHQAHLVPLQSIVDLLRHSDSSVRAATALLVVGVEDWLDHHVDLAEIKDVWRAAAADLRLPLPMVTSDDSAHLSGLVDTAPDLYAAMLSAVDPHDITAYYKIEWGPVMSTAPVLPGSLRTSILTAWRDAPLFLNMLRTLTGTDVDWLRDLLDAGVINEDQAIEVLAGSEPQPSLEDIARLLIPRGVDPVRIALRIQFGVHWGEEHDVIQRHLEYFRGLITSEDPSLRALGGAGMTYFEPHLRKALDKARRLDL